MATSKKSLPKILSYSFLDAWRGFAAMGVVMVHSCLPYINNHEPEAIKNPLFQVSVWGNLGVVMFFVISGYCISSAAYNCIRTDKSLSQYAFDRIRRIYPPYLVACVISLVLTWMVLTLQHWHILPDYPGVPPKSLPFKDISFWLTNLTLTHIPAREPGLLIVSWSLCYEAAFYLIIGAFLLLSKMVSPSNPLRRSRVLTCAHIATTLISLTWLLVSPETCPFPFDLWYQFGFGALLFAIISNKSWRSYYLVKMSAATSIVLCILYAYYHTSTETTLGHSPLKNQVSVCVIFFLILLLLQPFSERMARWKLSSIFMWLGSFSYSIYLAHLLFISFPDAALRRLGFTGSLYVVSYLVQILVAVGVGWLFFNLVEKRFILARQEKRPISPAVTTVK